MKKSPHVHIFCVRGGFLHLLEQVLVVEMIVLRYKWTYKFKEFTMNLGVLEEKSCSLKFETLVSKRKCTVCNKKLVDGTQAAVVYSKKGKVRGYFCSDYCIEKWT